MLLPVVTTTATATTTATVTTATIVEVAAVIDNDKQQRSVGFVANTGVSVGVSLSAGDSRLGVRVSMHVGVAICVKSKQAKQSKSKQDKAK